MKNWLKLREKQAPTHKSNIADFLLKHKLFSALLVVNLLFLIASTILQISRGNGNWQTFFAFVVLSISVSMVEYGKNIHSWIIEKHPAFYEREYKSAKILLFILFFCSPAFMFILSANVCKLYYQSFKIPQELNSTFTLLMLGNVVFQFGIAIYYVSELVIDLKRNCSTTYKAVIFLLDIITIIQLFATMYSSIFIFNHEAFSKISTDSYLTIMFDFTYFSAMTFMTGSTDITPISTLAKVVVLIETFLFVVGISIIILRFINNDDEKNGV